MLRHVVFRCCIDKHRIWHLVSTIPYQFYLWIKCRVSKRKQTQFTTPLPPFHCIPDTIFGMLASYLDANDIATAFPLLSKCLKRMCLQYLSSNLRKELHIESPLKTIGTNFLQFVVRNIRGVTMVRLSHHGLFLDTYPAPRGDEDESKELLATTNLHFKMMITLIKNNRQTLKSFHQCKFEDDESLAGMRRLYKLLQFNRAIPTMFDDSSYLLNDAQVPVALRIPWNSVFLPVLTELTLWSYDIYIISDIAHLTNLERLCLHQFDIPIMQWPEEVESAVGRLLTVLPKLTHLETNFSIIVPDIMPPNSVLKHLVFVIDPDIDLSSLCGLESVIVDCRLLNLNLCTELKLAPSVTDLHLDYSKFEQIADEKGQIKLKLTASGLKRCVIFHTRHHSQNLVEFNSEAAKPQLELYHVKLPAPKRSKKLAKQISKHLQKSGVSCSHISITG